MKASNVERTEEDGQLTLSAPRDLLESLSARRRKLIAPVFERPRAFVLMTIRELASELEADPATTLRTVRAMGFGGYREFQHYLHELSLSLTTPLERFQELSEKSDVAAQVQKILDLDSANLDLLRSRIDVEQLVSLAHRMSEASRIYLFAGDLAATLADYLAYHLMVIGMPCLVGSRPGPAEHLSHRTRRDDVVIAITFGQGLRQTVEALRAAHANDAYCVAITDTLVSPLTRFSHETHLAPRSTVAIGESYVPAIALINAIVAACAAVDPKRTRDLLGRASAGETGGYRWYQES